MVASLSMATKAQQARARAERSGPKQPKQARAKRAPRKVDTADTGVSATDIRVGAGASAQRNRSPRAARSAEVVQENSQTRPSRKSTRRSKNRGKIASSLERREIRRTSSSKVRAERAKVRRRG
jgi:hypothetical protein